MVKMLPNLRILFNLSRVAGSSASTTITSSRFPKAVTIGLAKSRQLSTNKIYRNRQLITTHSFAQRFLTDDPIKLTHKIFNKRSAISDDVHVQCTKMNPSPEVELEYQIEYPTYGGTNGNNMNENDKATRTKWVVLNDKDKANRIWPADKTGNENTGTEKEVLVVLFGWAGCEDRQLAKYSDIYLRRGCVVVRCIVPPKITFLQPEKLPLYARRFVRVLKESKLDSHPVFFHTFSNGGSFMHSYVLRELSAVQTEMPLNIRGAIYDSAPCPRNINLISTAVGNIVQNLSVLRYPIGMFVATVAMTHVLYNGVKSAVVECGRGETLPAKMLDKDSVKVSREEIPLKHWLGRLCKMRNHNCLFLYSDKDTMLSWKQVEEVADIIASHGNKVSKRKFLGSDHVLHYRKYPEEYVQEVTKFIRENMEEKKRPVVFWETY